MPTNSSSQSSPSRKLGFIGLGIMGRPMAMNLLATGHELIVWNRTAAKADALVEQGATLAASPAAVAAHQPEVIFLNVTDTPDVDAVLFAPPTAAAPGLASSARPGLIVVDHSTISPVATQRFARRLADDHGVTLLDAPVSGGDVGARDGTLSIMVGGPAEAFEQVRPLLEILGKSIVHVGGSGTGQACKACNQVAVAGALLGVVEALALAQKTGLDPRTMLRVVGGGAGGSWQLENLGPKIATNDHAPGFMIDYLLKDLAIVLDTARQNGLPLELAALAERLMREASRDGAGELGTQAVARVYTNRGDFHFKS